jgi:hypothetical protein
MSFRLARSADSYLLSASVSNYRDVPWYGGVASAKVLNPGDGLRRSEFAHPIVHGVRYARVSILRL